MNDVFVWSAWFSFICGLQLLAELSKHRYEYVSDLHYYVSFNKYSSVSSINVSRQYDSIVVNIVDVM